MDGFLKQSTASQTRWIGPFVDDVDFKTAETALSIANTDIKISKNGGASASKNSGGGTHDVNGMYAVTWDATDTATVGELKYSVKVAGALQVFGSYVVLEEAIYDALLAASANAWTGAAGSTTLTALADGSITAAKIAADAITAAKVAADVSTEINSAVLTRLGTPAGADVSTDIAAIKSQTAAIETDTAEIGAAGAGLTALASQASVNTIDDFLDTEIAAIVGYIDTEVSAILALLDDARGEVAQGAPPASADLATKIDWLYTSWRNKRTNDGTDTKLFADDGTTVIAKQATSEAAGTVTKAEWITGA
jgi:hypothetical protein